MTTREERIAAITARLQRAQQTRTPCQAPSQDFPELSVREAYEVQARQIEARGGQLIGRKIGLTSPAIQEWLNVTEPDFGVLLDSMIIADGMKAPIEQLLQPRIEAEVAFVLKADLHGPAITPADVIRATDFLLPALEIIDSRIADWNITFEDTIADNASSGLFVLGNRPVPLSDVDLYRCGMALRKNGRLVSTGAGAACLGNPVNAVVWLVNKLASFDTSLRKGDIILSGALGPVTNIEAGDHIDAQISGLGSVRVRF